MEKKFDFSSDSIDTLRVLLDKNNKNSNLFSEYRLYCQFYYRYAAAYKCEYFRCTKISVTGFFHLNEVLKLVKK